jgi:hypothetical protein
MRWQQIHHHRCF